MTQIRVQGLSRRGFRVNSNKRVSYNESTLVDLDRYPEIRILSNRQGDYYTLPELEFSSGASGAVAEGYAGHFVAPKKGSIKSVVATLGAAPDTGEAVEVEVRVNGDAQATISLGEGELVANWNGDVALSAGDMVTYQVTEAAGSNLRLLATFS